MNRWLVAAGLWFLAHLLILLPGAPTLSWAVVTGLLLLGVVLPGGLLALLILGRAGPAPLEWIVFAAGFGFVAYCFALLIPAVLPGPLLGWQVIVTLDGVIVLLALAVWRWARVEGTPLAQRLPPPEQPPSNSPPRGGEQAPARQDSALLSSKGELGRDSAVLSPSSSPPRRRELSIGQQEINSLPLGGAGAWATKWPGRGRGASGRERKWLPLVGLVSVLLVAALLRLPNLGYSDFQGDEARSMLRASEVIQGYPSALVIHKKGPMEILIPTGLYAVQQRIDEAQARLPFTLAGILGVLVVYLLGWRMFGPVAGWVAGMLLAVDGYLIGFARIVQYQSVVLLMSALVVLALYLHFTSDRPHARYLWAAALCFVGGVYAHYEALWVVIPGSYLLWHYGRRTGDWRGLIRAVIGPALVVLGLLGVFFVPFLLDARWDQTARDIFGNRIGSRFPYNNLPDFFERTTIYNSTYYVILMILGALGAQGVMLQRIWPRRIAWTISVLTGLGLALTAWRPDWLRLGGMDHTWLFFALAVGTMVLPRRVPPAMRTAWLWFGVPMVLAIFFVDKPNSHVYGFFTGWALVNGAFWEAMWGWVRQRVSVDRLRRVVRPAAVAVAAGVTLVLGYYTFQMFTATEVELLRTWTANRLPGYWTPYSLPTRGSLFGFPYKNGWKVVGALYADGTLDAPFTSNESNRVGEWYSRGAYFCPPDAEYYMLPTTLQPDEALEDPARLAELAHNHFREWGVVTVNGDPRLRIFTTRPVDGPPRIFEESLYAAHFDAELTAPAFPKPGPALATTPAVPVTYRLNEHLWLKGYTLPDTQVEQGGTLTLDLYWEMAQALDIEDKVFVQVIDLTTLRKIAQRDAEPGCTKYSMDEWRAGELNYDPYRLTIAPDAPPGVYTVLVGVYDAETQARYAVYDAQGKPLGDGVSLTTVEVVAP